MGFGKWFCSMCFFFFQGLKPQKVLFVGLIKNLKIRFKKKKSIFVKKLTQFIIGETPKTVFLLKTKKTFFFFG